MPNPVGFEYQVKRLSLWENRSYDRDEIGPQLNRWDDEGWEPLEFLSNASGSDDLYVLLRRAKDGT